MTVKNDRVPFNLRPRHILRLHHVVHVAVAIVVVPHIFLVQIRQRADLVRRAQVFSIPRHNFVLPSGFSVGHSIKITLLRIASTSGSFCEETSLYARLIDAARPPLPRNAAAIDVHNSFALTRKFTCLRLRQAPAVCQPLRNLLIFAQTGEIFRRRNNRNVPIEPSRRLATLISLMRFELAASLRKYSRDSS